MPLHPLFSSAVAATLTALVLPAQRGITLESAPVPGRTLDLRVDVPAAFGARPVALLVSGHTDRTQPVPGVGGTLRLDPGSIGLVQLSGSDPNGTARFAVTLPVDPSLVGLTIDFQGLDADPVSSALTLTDDEAVVTLVDSIPSALVTVAATGARGAEIALVDEARFAAPSPLGGRYEPAALAIPGRRGYVQAYRDAGLVGGRASLDVASRAEVTIDGRGPFRVAHLPNGRGLTVARDADNPEDWVVLSCDAAQGGFVEIVDARRTRLPALSGLEFGPPFADWWGFSGDGEVAVVVVDYAASNRPRNTDPNDEVLLIRTDGTPWPGTQSPVRDVSAPPQQWKDGTLVVANERLFLWNLRGELWSAPLDGSRPLTAVTLPRTGGGLTSVFGFERSFRMSDDRRTVVFPITGSNTVSRDFDAIALTGIDRRGFRIANITGFPGSERLEAEFGDSRTGVDYFADLAPDGATFACITGFGQAAGPHRLWIVPTDGSATGRLTPVAGIPSTAVRMSTPHVFADGSVVVFAGPTASSLDVYRVPPGTNLAQRLTSTSDIAVLWSLAPFGAAAGQRLVYVERTPGAFGGDLVAIDPSGRLRSLTGSRYNPSGNPGLQVPPDPGDAFLRSDPTSPSTIWFVARPQNAGTTWFDDEVFRASLSVAVPAQQVTANNGSGAVDQVVDVTDLSLHPFGGGFAHVEHRGAAPFAMPVDPRVIGTLPDGTRSRLDAVDADAGVAPGSLRVGSRVPAALWVGTDTLGLRSVLRYAPLDGSAVGWPLRLGGKEPTAARVAPLAVDF